MKLMPDREIKEISRIIERETTNEGQPRWVRRKARYAAEQGIRSALSELESAALGGAMKFRKKPVVVEAWEWRYGCDREEVEAPEPLWVAAARGKWPEVGGLTAELEHPDGPRICIATLEGVMVTRPGDWIIRGVKGELYPCKPDIFEATYDAVEWTAPAEALKEGIPVCMDDEMTMKHAKGLYIDAGKPGFKGYCGKCGEIVMRVTCGTCQPQKEDS